MDTGREGTGGRGGGTDCELDVECVTEYDFDRVDEWRANLPIKNARELPLKK